MPSSPQLSSSRIAARYMAGGPIGGTPLSVSPPNVGVLDGRLHPIDLRTLKEVPDQQPAGGGAQAAAAGGRNQLDADVPGRAGQHREIRDRSPEHGAQQLTGARVQQRADEPVEPQRQRAIVRIRL